MADTDSKSWMSCLGWGCLTVVVLAVLAIGAGVAMVYRGSSAADEVVEAYLEAVGAGRMEDAFACLGPGFTAERDLEALVEFDRANREAYGDCGEWRFGSTALNRTGGRTSVDLRYRSECERGPVEARFIVERIDGAWLIQDIEYREPTGPLAVDTCSRCGGVLPPGARFCPFCGAATATESGEPSSAGGDGAGEAPE
jgi:hypothetical protein